MRFDNWDVLIMPLGSHIPIPEFRVEAYPVDDIEAPPINNIFNFTVQTGPANITSIVPAGSPNTPPNSSGCPSPQVPLVYAQMPLLSGFVPSQSEGTAFKVSIHRWEQILFTLDPVTINVTGRIPCCEVRVFVDGTLVSDGAIKHDTIWPLQIGTGYSANPKLSRGYLRWPKFHEDQLSQNFWGPSEDYGRIKVVISEGIMHQATGRITRTKNLVSFAFQHAPFEILQGANIAWPSERLWLKPVSRVLNNTEANPNLSVTTSSENDNHEAIQNQAQPLGYPWIFKPTPRDLNTNLPSPAADPLLSQAANKTTTQDSPTKPDTNQPTSSADEPLTGLYTPTSPTNNHNSPPWIPGLITTPLPDTLPSCYKPAETEPQAPRLPARKKQATETNINHSMTTEQAAAKPIPSNEPEAEKVSTKKIPAKRTRAAKNVKSITTAGDDESLNAKPRAGVRKASTKKKTTSFSPPMSSSETKTEEMNDVENVGDILTTTEQNLEN